MGLHAELPDRLLQAQVYANFGITFLQHIIQRLQAVVAKRQALHGLHIGHRKARLRPHQLELMALALHPGGAGFGADAEPVDAFGRGDAATAISKPWACKASISAVSTCNKGSPPVSTTKRWAAKPAGHRAAIWAARAAALSKRPPSVPSVPTKSVSQKRQTALARSCSRPDHKLHPAKRQNTAGRPACAPSPCKV